MWILQISDIHLSAAGIVAVDRGRLLAMMRDAVSEAMGNPGQLSVCICGDITSEGSPSGYGLASTFFREMRETFDRELIFWPCPGNHDIVADGAQQFRHFNRFSWRLTRDRPVLFSALKCVACWSTDDESTDVLLVNSAYHGNHSYGLVDLDQMEAALRGSGSRYRVIVTHHHCVPMEVEDRSAIANAYGFLELALEHNVSAILHGHAHMGTILSIGKGHCSVIGVGSLFFQLAPNFNNQFNLVQYENGVVVRGYAYRFVADLPKRGRVGGLDVKELEIL